MTFEPATMTPTTVEEAVAFWKHWSRYGWFHPDDTYDDMHLNEQVAAAWGLKDPWDDDMTPIWDAAIGHDRRVSA